MAQTNLFKQLAANNLVLEEAPFPSELGMETFLMDNPQILSFGDEQKGYPRIVGCEISLDRASDGGDCPQKHGLHNAIKTDHFHSRLDILVQYGRFKFGILELKKGDVGLKALRQLCDYLTPERQREIIDIITTEDDLGEYVYLQDEKNADMVEFIGVLVGSRASEELQNIVPTNNGWSEEGVWPDGNSPAPSGKLPKIFKIITLSRFRNPTTGDLYVLANKMEQAKSNSEKDLTKYAFGKYSYLSKGQLVNKIVRDYVETHSPVTLTELQNIFKDIKGYGVFEVLEKAQQINDSENSSTTRYYTRDEMTIKLADGVVIATSTQWYGGPGKNMEKFLKKAELLGYKISICR